jgi:hypothetical protein
MSIDFDARYRVAGMEGVAFYLRGYVKREQTMEEWELGADAEDDTSMVRAVMVGDDREHVIDVDDLERISEDDYCHSCGQIGCTHDGRG